MTLLESAGQLSQFGVLRFIYDISVIVMCYKIHLEENSRWVQTTWCTTLMPYIHNCCLCDINLRDINDAIIK